MYDDDPAVALLSPPADETVQLLRGKLPKNLKALARTMSRQEVRGLVDTYYQVQGYRIRAANQARAARQGVDPHPVVQYVWDTLEQLEANIASLMDVVSKSQRPGRWMRSILGVGPVLAAGFLAHFDVTQARYAGGFLSFCGYNPTRQWLGKEKARAVMTELCGPRGPIEDEGLAAIAGRLNYPLARIQRWATDAKTGKYSRACLLDWLSRRPWNAKAKVLCFKLGQSLVMVSGRDRASLYSQLYRERKLLEIGRNESGHYAATAQALAESGRYGTDTEAYKAYSTGTLPKGHLDMRARRYAVKMFVDHLFQVMYEVHYGKPAPVPYILQQEPETHTHRLTIPNWPCE